MDDHVVHMSRLSNREKILEEGLKVVHERGFAASSVRDIVSAAGVPLGSFSNHFASKEAFGKEVIERYFANSQTVMRDTLRNDAKPPLARLKEYIAQSKTKEACGGDQGCLLGNLTAETGGAADAMRLRLNEIFAEVGEAVAYCLEAAVRAGELAADLDCREVARFIVSSHQGAILLAKAEHSPAPIARLEHMLFSVVLRPLH
jgi:TetR/AcrR family transcriptional regulator, transcriptional repressor for nem operon